MLAWVTCRLMAPGVRAGLGSTTPRALTTSPPVAAGRGLGGVARVVRCAGVEPVADVVVEPAWVEVVSAGEPAMGDPAEPSAAVFAGLPAAPAITEIATSNASA